MKNVLELILVLEPIRKPIGAMGFPDRLLITATVFLFAATLRIATATDYYVSTNGLDEISNNGLSPTSSWRNIDYALTQAPPGNTINVGPGEYTNSLNITNSIIINGSDSYIATNPAFSRHTSATVIKPYFMDNPGFPMVIFSGTNDVTIQNLTIEGDADSDGSPDVVYGIYTTNKPINVNHCVIRNIGGYGVMCSGYVPYPTTNDTDAIRSYFRYNLITNISATSAVTATALYLRHAPATCEFNEFSDITGSNANGGMYLAECKYTSKTANWITFRSNSFNRCSTAIWANQAAGSGEKMVITGNNIENGVVGIRITAAEGPALVLSNNIAVSGISQSTNAIPARGIWIQADIDPWGISNTLALTEHILLGNRISGSSTNADNTVGLLFAYDTLTWTNMNNGVRALALNNSVEGFDYGSLIVSGSNGVRYPTNPLVQVTLHSNDFSGNFSYGLFATGITDLVDASNNWWGYYFGPTGSFGNAVSTNVIYAGWPLGAFWMDTNGNSTNDWLDTDDDGDSLVDTNEMFFGSSPVRTNTDDDPMNDWAEFIAGTSPTNPRSFFQFAGIDSGLNSNSMELSWASVAGRKYTIYRYTNLVEGSYIPLTNNLGATPPMNIFTDTTAYTEGPYFYRVSVTN